MPKRAAKLAYYPTKVLSHLGFSRKVPNNLLMNLLAKIESAINTILIWIGAFLTKKIKGIVPPKVLEKISIIQKWFVTFLNKLNNVHKNVLPWIIAKIHSIKSWIMNHPLKNIIITHFANSEEKIRKSKDRARFSKFKSLFMTPFLLLSKWLQGLSATQSLLLLTFSAGSILSGVSMVFSGKRLVEHHASSGRTPASTEEIAEYDRPDYYKKQFKHLDLTNFRLPVYVPEVNEERTVDIDFTATLSNRMAKKFLEKYEFQLRDHLILNIEPVKASFPILEEGREIIRHKLQIEINQFLVDRGIDAYVTEIKITYVLAN